MKGQSWSVIRWSSDCIWSCLEERDWDMMGDASQRDGGVQILGGHLKVRRWLAFDPSWDRLPI